MTPAMFHRGDDGASTTGSTSPAVHAIPRGHRRRPTRRPHRRVRGDDVRARAIVDRGPDFVDGRLAGRGHRCGSSIGVGGRTLPAVALVGREPLVTVDAASNASYSLRNRARTTCGMTPPCSAPSSRSYVDRPWRARTRVHQLARGRGRRGAVTIREGDSGCLTGCSSTIVLKRAGESPRAQRSRRSCGRNAVRRRGLSMFQAMNRHERRTGLESDSARIVVTPMICWREYSGGASLAPARASSVTGN